LFLLAVIGLSALLWHAHRLAGVELLAGSGVLIVLLWLIGAITQPRPADDASAPMAAAR
jgi:hypothetical protein